MILMRKLAIKVNFLLTHPPSLGLGPGSQLSEELLKRARLCMVWSLHDLFHEPLHMNLRSAYLRVSLVLVLTVGWPRLKMGANNSDYRDSRTFSLSLRGDRVD